MRPTYTVRADCNYHHLKNNGSDSSIYDIQTNNYTCYSYSTDFFDAYKLFDHHFKINDKVRFKYCDNHPLFDYYIYGIHIDNNNEYSYDILATNYKISYEFIMNNINENDIERSL